MQGRNEGGNGGTIPLATNRYGGAEKAQQCHKYFNTVYLLLKDPRFKHAGAKLASCPGRDPTALHPC